MKKSLNVLAIFTLLVSLFIVPQNIVQAESLYHISDLEDGTYELDLKALKIDSDEESAAAGFLNKKAEIIIDGDRARVKISAPNSDMMKFNYIDIEGKRADVEETDEDLIFTVELDELKEILYAETSYEVPALGLVHDGVELRFQLEGLDDIPEKEEEKEEIEDPSGEPIDYEVNVDAMNNFIEAVVVTENDEIIVRFNTASAIADFKVDLGEGLKSAQRHDINDDYVDFMFKPESINIELDAQVSVDTGGYQSDYNFLLTIGKPEDNDGNKDDSDKEDPGKDEDLNEGESNKGDETENEDTEDANDSEQNKENEENEGKPVDPEKEEVKTYSIDYVVMHETEDKESVANSFFEKPGTIIEKDGTYYLQITVTKDNWSMIKGLNIEGKTVKYIEKDGKVIVQVTLGKDIPEELLLDMHINVPGLYDTNHKARLVLDLDSMKEIDAPSSIIDENGNNPNKNPEKPTFGEGKEKDPTEKTGATNSTAKNPKTGDTSNVLLYSTLFIGAALTLFVQVTRRKLFL